MSWAFDPVGHGATTIRYSPIPPETARQLGKVLQDGWGFQDLQEMREIEAYSAARSINYRINTKQGEFVLKRSFINSVSAQEFQHRCMTYLRDSGLPIPDVISSLQGTTYFAGEVYSLYEFIEGEYFDGSRRELSSAARNIALLEKVLKDMPFQEEIRTRKKTLVHHDYAGLERLGEKISFDAKKLDQIDSRICSLLPEVKEISQLVMDAHLETLPFQIIHYDLHSHNLLFSKERELKAFLDFDPMFYSQKIRDVGKALYRLSRTYGPLTERKQDCDSDLISRAKYFLDSYFETGELTSEELKTLPYIIIDDPLHLLIESLKGYYFEEMPIRSFEKKITLLKDATLFLTAISP